MRFSVVLEIALGYALGKLLYEAIDMIRVEFELYRLRGGRNEQGNNRRK